MPLIDFRTAIARQYGVCIAGAGPAGTAAALMLSEAGHAVLLVDAGGDLPEPPPGSDRSNPAAHEASDITHCRAFGGTSWKWGGRIMPFGEEEFAHYKWPVAYDSYSRHLDEAAAFLGGSVLGSPFLQPEARSFDLNAVEMLAADGPVSKRHAARLRAATGPDILLSATVVALLMEHGPEMGPACKGVRVRHGSDKADILANRTIVAMGGIETARLLLADQQRHPDSLGHLKALGSRYSGHLTGTIANIHFPKDVNVHPFGWHPVPDGGFKRQVFRSRASSLQNGSNMFFWAKNWPSEDAVHGSGILSAKHLLSRVKGGSSSAPSSGPGAPETVSISSVGAHLRNLVVDMVTSLRAAPGTYRAMTNATRKKLDHLIPNHANCYKLNYHAAQEQRPENRIELVGPVVPDQLPEIRIQYDYSDADIEAVIHGHAQLAQDLEKAGLAKLVYAVEASEQAEVVRQSARDGYHQIGTTRMGQDPHDSVVDSTCQLHSVHGLYLAGSGIFPSSGSAPPTQSIVAFALRLAEHVSSELKSSGFAASVSPELAIQTR